MIWVVTVCVWVKKIILKKKKKGHAIAAPNKRLHATFGFNQLIAVFQFFFRHTSKATTAHRSLIRYWHRPRPSNFPRPRTYRKATRQVTDVRGKVPLFRLAGLQACSLQASVFSKYIIYIVCTELCWNLQSGHVERLSQTDSIGLPQWTFYANTFLLPRPSRALAQMDQVTHSHSLTHTLSLYLCPCLTRLVRKFYEIRFGLTFQPCFVRLSSCCNSRPLKEAKEHPSCPSQLFCTDGTSMRELHADCVCPSNFWFFVFLLPV